MFKNIKEWSERVVKDDVETQRDIFLDLMYQADSSMLIHYAVIRENLHLFKEYHECKEESCRYKNTLTETSRHLMLQAIVIYYGVVYYLKVSEAVIDSNSTNLYDVLIKTLTDDLSKIDDTLKALKEQGRTNHNFDKINCFELIRGISEYEFELEVSSLPLDESNIRSIAKTLWKIITAVAPFVIANNDDTDNYVSMFENMFDDMVKKDDVSMRELLFPTAIEIK